MGEIKSVEENKQLHVAMQNFDFFFLTYIRNKCGWFQYCYYMFPNYILEYSIICDNTLNNSF